MKNVELGQLCFGNRFASYDAPDFVTAGFMLLENEIQRVEFNRRQKTFESPLSSGAFNLTEMIYKNKVFQIHAYYWGENRRLKARPNFKCGKFEVFWYKYMGRGMTMNQNVDANQFFRIIEKCMKYLRDTDKAEFEKNLKVK